MGYAIDLERRRQPGFDYGQFANYTAPRNRNDPKQVQQPMLPSRSDSVLYTTAPKEKESSTIITIKRGGSLPLFPAMSLLLHIFWNDHLDTQCLLCGHDFQKYDPPVRTVSLEQISPLIVQIHNRHLGCIRKHGIPFIPVSHVWHECIAAANLSQKDSLEASKLLFKVLSEMLPIVTAKFSHLFNRVELWHDYLSIPQWQHPVQHALLLMLPHIYGTAPLCLIHLDDVTSEKINVAANMCTYQSLRAKGDYSTPSYANCTGPSNMVCFGDEHDYRTATNRILYDALGGFFSARWFQRMWVSLEYAHCRQACVYTEDHVIVWNGQGNNCDSFSSLFNGFQQKMRECIEGLGMHEFSKAFTESTLPLLGPLADMRKSIRNATGRVLSFGEALTFVAGRNCTSYRDRFLAMSSFLKCGDYASTVQNVPDEAAEACLWLARKCIRNGDYSPLLMLRQNESIHPRAHWLVGHQKMSWNMWDLGATQTYPHEGISIRDNVVQLQLDYVGIVEKLWMLDMKAKNHIAIFNLVVETILSHNGYIDTFSFLDTLDRIYAVPAFLRSDSMPRRLSQLSYLVRGSHSESLQSLLLGYLHSHPGSSLRSSTVMAIAQLVRLHERLKGTMADSTRLSYAANPLHQMDSYNDCLAAVRCPGCKRSFIDRVSVLKHINGPFNLFRIADLGYASSLHNGIGLLILEKEIVGRMIYGIPACRCKVPMTVEIC